MVNFNYQGGVLLGTARPGMARLGLAGHGYARQCKGKHEIPISRVFVFLGLGTYRGQFGKFLVKAWEVVE